MKVFVKVKKSEFFSLLDYIICDIHLSIKKVIFFSLLFRFSYISCYIRDMDNFIERLEWILDQKGITKKKLSEDLNIRRETLSVWKKTDGMPRADVAMAISVYLDISLDWLITGIEKAPEEYDLLTKQVISMFNQLTDKEKETVLLVLQSLCDKEKKETDEDFKKVYG